MKIKNRIVREAWEMGKVLLFSLLVAFVLKENVVASANVPTGSMEDTIMAGSKILINRLAYVFEEPERGDVVAFYCPDDPSQIFLKRVMGVPGDTIQGMNGMVYVNGLALTEDYTSIRLDSDFERFTVPEGCHFMLGDNRNDSWDSRYWKNTIVEMEAILGKVKVIYYPELKILQ